MRGDRPLDESLGAAVTMIGSRAATGYGEHVAFDMAHYLAATGTTVVSSGSFGIAAAAHRGCLVGRGVTAAVLVTGIDVVHPTAHDSLFRHIAGTGVLIGEYPPGTVPTRHRFISRNRLLAALSAATVVVEAGLRSGTRHSAAVARVLDRPVLVVPGPVTSAQSAGCHELLRSHRGELVTSAGDVAQVLDELAEPAGQVFGRAGGDAVSIHHALPPHQERTALQLASTSGLPISAVRAALTDLEITGSAVRGTTGWYQS